LDEARDRKFRQAAFGYLIVGILYESGVWVVWKNGLLPAGRGSVWVWLAIGAVIAGAIVWSLWRFRTPWLPRVIFALHALRVPALIDRAFFDRVAGEIPHSLYGAALVVVLINLWLLARAGWDL
jgi:hypothetical protein